ncbi:MAG: hypothetical protein PHE15_04575 [Dehalococcoidales bacterium]|nr:hypothetical protein [Dehalococcoidales bacterium]
MTTENIISTPPVLPVRQPAAVTIPPPKPPTLSGVKPIQEKIISPPVLPSAVTTKPPAKSKQEEVAHRRKTIAEAGSGDPGSTAAMLVTGFKNTARTIPLLIKKYWWIALVIVAVWTLAASWDPLLLTLRYPSLSGLIDFFSPIVTFLVFITVAYTNFIAKSIYALIVFKVIIPLVQRIRKEGFVIVIKSFSSIIPGIKSNITECGISGIPVFVSLLGTGLISSNFLTGNNRGSGVLVSIALALSLVKALNDGKTSTPFMASRVVSKDIFKLLKRSNPVKNNHVYLGISGFMTGLLGSMILMVTRGLPQGDFLGYYIGVLVLLAGIGLYFIKTKAKPAE